MLVRGGRIASRGVRVLSSTTAGAANSMSTTTSRQVAPSEAEVGVQMREVLRSFAQPVVVAVARTRDIPSSSASIAPGSLPPATSSSSKYHGATLTSFASLTLEPHPLVAFSLRLPSRMADYLRPQPGQTAPTPVTVSLLSGANQPVADALARPGQDQAPIFAVQECWDDGDPPALTSAVGCLRCEVCYSVPLRHVGGKDTTSTAEGSELFICRVVDAIKSKGEDSLIHYQRDYYSVRSKD